MNSFNEPDRRDEDRLRFLANQAHDLNDHSKREAQLVDDISEFGERELKPLERRLADQMMERHRERQRALRQRW